MIKIEAPDGSVAEFPDGTPDSVIENVMRQEYGGLSASSASAASGGMSWLDVGKQALTNVPSSAGQFAADIAQPLIHPIETAKSLGKVVAGGASKLIPGEQRYEQNFDAVAQFFADRYGGIENLKKTIATDPVGFAADVSAVLTLGSGAAARVPATAGKVSKVARTAARTLDPVNAAAKLAGGVGKMGASVVGDLLTHTGAESIKRAASAGYRGGQAGEAFRQHMRGLAPMEEVVADAREALKAVRQERGKVYKAGMAGVARSNKVLNFNDVDKALSRSVKIKQFKGVDIDVAAGETRNKIIQAVNKWKMLDPADFHTAEGFDALKQKIGSIRDSTQYGTPDRVIADIAYNAVKNEIVKQAPQYARVMKGYEQASELIREMERTLSLNPKASIDTSLRKLQSVLRNNANTNYGKRVDLANLLSDAGAPLLMEKLAGQALNSFAPRGLGRAVGGLTAVGVTGAGALNPTSLLATLPLLAAQSPRLMGEAIHAGGRLAGAAGQALPPIPRALPPAAYQIGRMERVGGLPLLAEDEERQRIGLLQ